MAAEDVAKALLALDGDPEVRRRVAEGDFAALGDLALTGDEQRLVRGATPVLPDGDPAKVLVAVGRRRSRGVRPKAGENAGYWPAGTGRAIQYVQSELTDPRVQAQFEAWQRSRADEFP